MSFDRSVAARPHVEFAPPPAAFDMTPVAFGDHDPRALSAQGLCHWLSHAQLDCSGAEPVHTSRSVVQVTGVDGLQTAASFTTSFNPRHERLVVHAIRVHRNGDVREAGRPDAFELIQRELNMERAIYDGRMTAHMVIPDVREGDVVETVYSVIGGNPVLQGRIGWRFILQWQVPVVETRCTLRVAPERRLTIQRLAGSVEPQDFEEEGVRVLDWRARDMPVHFTDPGAPPGFVDFAAVHVADEGEWSDVAEVFRGLYETGDVLPDDLAETAAALRTDHADDAGRVAAGLRLVQNSLRYHSVSIGEGGYRPRPVRDIWSTRYGDCKDASVLLTAILRALEIDAVCALVNTFMRDAVGQETPNVQAFNHCIVRVRLGEAVYWLDPTNAPQAGDLAHLTQAAYGRALPLVEGAQLETMSKLPLAMICEVTEDWTFGTGKGDPARLEMISIYRSWRADGMRHWIANQGADNLARLLREQLESEMRSPLKALEAPAVGDDVENNVLTLVERYEAASPFSLDQNGGGDVFVSRDDLVGPQLQQIGQDRRTAPLQLGLRRSVQTTRVFRFPHAMNIREWRETVSGPADIVLDSRFEWKTATEGHQTLLLRVGQEELPPSDADAYRTFVDRARSLNGINFQAPFGASSVRRAVKTDNEVPWGWIIGPVLIAMMIIGRALSG